MQLLNFSLKKSAILSASEYARLYNENVDNIEAVNMILPRIGADSHFGKFKVVYSPNAVRV